MVNLFFKKTNGQVDPYNNVSGPSDPGYGAAVVPEAKADPDNQIQISISKITEGSKIACESAHDYSK